MKSPHFRLLLSIFIVVGIVIAGPLYSLVDIGGAGEQDDLTGTKSRKVIENITTFTGGNAGKEIGIGTGGGSDTTLNVTLPKRSKVLSAEVEVEGRSGFTKKVFNFNDTTNHSAYKGDESKPPPSAAPDTYERTKLLGKEITDLQNNDTNLAYNNSAGLKGASRLYHLFKFKIDVASPSSLNIYWVGESYRVNSIGVWVNEVYSYIYCFTNSTWVKVHEQKNPINQKVDTFKIDKTIDPASGYVNSTSSLVYFLVHTPEINPTSMDSGTIGTNFVELTVFTSDLSYPSGVSLDVGADGDPEWTKSGELNGKHLISDSEGLKTELQEHIDAAGTDEGDLTVVFKVAAQTGGRIWIGNLSIQIEALEHNDPPDIVPGKFQESFIQEDDVAAGDNLIDLLECFTDDHDTTASLSFDISEAGDASTLEAKLDADGHHLDFIPAPNFYGSVGFRVNATDSGADELPDTFDDKVRSSQLFNVTVLPINDPPLIIASSTDLAVNESDTLVFELEVQDVDDLEFIWDSNDSARVFVLPYDPDSSKAQVEFAPGSEDTGQTISFQVMVFDDGGGQGSLPAKGLLNFTVEVVNLNDPPRFVELTILPDKYSEPIINGTPVKLTKSNGAFEDEYFNISFEAKDPDIGIEPLEKLVFEISDTDFIDGDISIGAESGIVSFKPTNADVGFVHFNVSVLDWKERSAVTPVSIEVKNRNDPPLDVKIVKPVERSFSENDTIDFEGEATDSDLLIPGSEEFLTYIWMTNRSGGVIGTGKELTGISLDPGWHKIALKVIDSKNEEASASIEIFVAAVTVDDVPDGDDKNDTDGDGDDDDKGKDQNLTGDSDSKEGAGTYLALLAVVIIVIVVLVMFFFMRRKGKPEDEVTQGDLNEQPQMPVPQFEGGQLPPMQYPDPNQAPQYYPQQDQTQYGSTPEPVYAPPEGQLPVDQMSIPPTPPQPAEQYYYPQPDTFKDGAVSTDGNNATINSGKLEKRSEDQDNTQ